MPTFGLLPSDVVANSRGDVLGGVTLSLYATQADALASTGLLTAVTSDLLGRWSYTHATLGVAWVRTPPSMDFPAGVVYPVIAPEVLTGAIVTGPTGPPGATGPPGPMGGTVSGLWADTDGVPYFDMTGSGTAYTLAPDTDGAPFFA